MAWQPDLQQIAAVLGCTRSRAPLVHAITNQITMNDCANVVLSVGAGVVMASSVREVEEVAGLADALVLNTGNPGTDTLQAMRLAGRAANRKGIPVVLDRAAAQRLSGSCCRSFPFPCCGATLRNCGCWRGRIFLHAV